MPSRNSEQRVTESDLHADNVAQNPEMLSGMSRLRSLVVTARGLIAARDVDGADRMLLDALGEIEAHLIPLEIEDARRQRLQGELLAARHRQEMRAERESRRESAKSEALPLSWDVGETPRIPRPEPMSRSTGGFDRSPVDRRAEGFEGCIEMTP